MSKKIHWKTIVLYAGVALLGILLGSFVANSGGWTSSAGLQPGVARAAEAVSAGIQAPNSPNAQVGCTPVDVGSWSDRIYVKCLVAIPEDPNVNYFAAPTTDSKEVARILSIMLTAKSLGKNLWFYYEPDGDGSAFGCDPANCRPFYGIEVIN